MTKSLLKITLFVSCFFSAYYGTSQTYTLTNSTVPYADLVAPNVLDQSNADTIPSGSSSFSVYQGIPIGFDFDLLGVSYDSIRIAQYGFASLSNGGADETLVLIYDCRLDYFQGDSSLSSINYTLEGAPGSQIFKCEFNNYGFELDTNDQYFANFQLWLFEDCNEFEIHVGPTSVGAGIFNDSLDAAPLMGYASLSPGGESAYIIGSTSAPVLGTSASNVMSDHPGSGTVYKFSDCQVGLDEEITNSSISIYPNPTEDFITIETNESAKFTELIIRDIQGLEVKRANIKGLSSPTINIQELPAAVYFLEIKSESASTTSRFIKL